MWVYADHSLSKAAQFVGHTRAQIGRSDNINRIAAHVHPDVAHGIEDVVSHIGLLAHVKRIDEEQTPTIENGNVGLALVQMNKEAPTASTGNVFRSKIAQNGRLGRAVMDFAKDILNGGTLILVQGEQQDGIGRRQGIIENAAAHLRSKTIVVKCVAVFFAKIC